MLFSPIESLKVRYFLGVVLVTLVTVFVTFYYGYDFTAKWQGESLLNFIASWKSLDCNKLFEGDESAISQAKQSRIFSRRFDPQWTSNCNIFRARGYMTTPVNEEERDFPLAFTIQMYKDVHQLERLLRAIYRPQNTYCINVDLSEPARVHKGVLAIATCFNNIHITTVDVVWGNFSQVQADLQCMRVLYQEHIKWKYILSLTGQEFPLKTNLDIVRILRTLNGSNLSEGATEGLPSELKTRWNFLPPPPVNITMAWGSCHWALTRAFVNYTLYDPRALAFQQWAKYIELPDEHFFQSLNQSPQLNVPGSYTGNQSEKGDVHPILRYKQWRQDHGHCKSGKFARDVCIFGVGDLQYMDSPRTMFANKFYESFQPVTLQCLEKRHYDWTKNDSLGIADGRIDLQAIRRLPQIVDHLPSGLEHR